MQKQKPDKHQNYPNDSKPPNKTLNYIFIDSIMECIKTVEDILLKQRIIALDCEGVLLSKEGRLTLIQV